jgi:hypothetical protein
MTLEEEATLRNKTSLWRQFAVGTWLAQAVLLALYLLGQEHLPIFGYIPWKDGPRMEFESEVACWRHLALAKKTNEFLYAQDCTAEKKP